MLHRGNRQLVVGRAAYLGNVGFNLHGWVSRHRMSANKNATGMVLATPSCHGVFSPLRTGLASDEPELRMISNNRLKLLLWARRRTPEQIKVGLRTLRLLAQPSPPSAPDIPQAQLDGARLLTSRVELLRHLPKGGACCELGTQTGNFARQILDICAPQSLDLVDVTFELCRADVLEDPRVGRHEMLTTRFLAAQPEDRFDWIYVDADHAYSAVAADIAAAQSRVKPGGLLIFNDFARMMRPGLGTFGVHQAVCEFAAREGWPVAFLAFQGEALYDIALRRPL